MTLCGRLEPRTARTAHARPSPASSFSFHGSTGPPPSYLWPNLTTWHAKVEHLCARSEVSGYAEPLDSTTSTVEQQLGVGKREVWLDEWLDGAPW